MTQKPSAAEYDLIVIGAGSAGNGVARAAGRQGWRTALVERDRLGGTCLHYGCDPTKSMLHCAKTLARVRQGAAWGLEDCRPRLDFARLMDYVHENIREIRGDEPDGGLAEDGVELVRATGRFLDPHRLEADGRELRARRFVIATGTGPVVPSLPGIDRAPLHTNETVFGLRELPARMLVLGAGPVGCEFAQMFRRFGAQVTLAEMQERLLPPADAEPARALAARLTEEGVRLMLGATLEALEEQRGEWVARFDSPEGPREVAFDSLMLAVGRRPNIDTLRLDRAGVETHEGGIRVDAGLRTSQPHIWAAGDVTGRRRFTHAAGDDASLLSANLLHDAGRESDQQPFPWVVYTDPELAQVGLTEYEAREAGHQPLTAEVQTTRITRARLHRERHGLCKLVADGRDGRLLGATLFCPNAGELIHEIALALKAGLGAAELGGTIHAYPTMAQALRTMGKRIDRQRREQD